MHILLCTYQYLPHGLLQFFEASMTHLGFHADAWNMLHGASQENWETEANLDELHAAATNAKRNIETISKVSFICLSLHLIGDAAISLSLAFHALYARYFHLTDFQHSQQIYLEASLAYTYLLGLWTDAQGSSYHVAAAIIVSLSV